MLLTLSVLQLFPILQRLLSSFLGSNNLDSVYPRNVPIASMVLQGNHPLPEDSATQPPGLAQIRHCSVAPGPWCTVASVAKQLNLALLIAETAFVVPATHADRSQRRNCTTYFLCFQSSDRVLSSKSVMDLPQALESITAQDNHNARS